jgi:hypothetical protein
MATVNVINCGNNSLPRSLDVKVTVQRPGAEVTTDLSVPIFVQVGGGFDFGAGRLGFYSTQDAVTDDTRVTAQGLLAARDFFAQPKRAARMAIGQVFTMPQTGYLLTGATGLAAAFIAVTNGSFSLSIDGVSADITSLNFSTDTTLAQIASRIQTAVRAIATGGFTLATVAVSGTQFKISSGTAGDTSSVSVLEAVSPATGTDISGPGFMNGRLGTALIQPGYTPGDLVSELALIAEAARCGGSFVYGWALDASYRDTPDQVAAGQWAQARLAVMPLVSNSPLAWDAGSTSDLGPEIEQLGLFRAWPYFHDQVAFYPDMALLAVMLSVNYAQKNSTITAKFKDLIGIPTVNINETQWSVLEGKGYNTFTLTGNTARVNREGTTGNTAWYMDDVTNLDNFGEEIQVAEYNVFLRNGAVGNDPDGQALMQDGLQPVCEKYIFNGAFSARRVLDLSQVSGFRIDPPYTIIPSPFEIQTVSDRNLRIGPPFTIDVNLRGAMHSIAVNINAYS